MIKLKCKRINGDQIKCDWKNKNETVHECMAVIYCSIEATTRNYGLKIQDVLDIINKHYKEALKDE